MPTLRSGGIFLFFYFLFTNISCSCSSLGFGSFPQPGSSSSVGTTGSPGDSSGSADPIGGTKSSQQSGTSRSSVGGNLVSAASPSSGSHHDFSGASSVSKLNTTASNNERFRNSGGWDGTPTLEDVLRAQKIEMAEIDSAETLVSDKVLSYLSLLMKGENNDRTSLIPNSGFWGNVTKEKVYGFTPSQKADGSKLKEDEAGSDENYADDEKGYYFEITQGSFSNIYNYTYERYRANKIDCYISGKVQATVGSSTVELQGELRIHSNYNNALKGSENVIIIKFGDGQIQNSGDKNVVVLGKDNIAQRGKLTIRYYDKEKKDFEKIYNLGRARLTDVDKKQINTLGIFTVE